MGRNPALSSPVVPLPPFPIPSLGFGDPEGVESDLVRGVTSKGLFMLFKHLVYRLGF